MVRFALIGVVFALGVACVAHAGGKGPANPLKKAKAGDWVRYTRTRLVDGTVTDKNTVKMAVVKVSGDKLTIKVEVTDKDDNSSTSVQMVNLKDPYYPTRFLHNDEGKVEETGKEKLKVGDKTYECTWATLTIRTKKQDGKVAFGSKIKLWTSPEIPLDGVVKADFKNQGDDGSYTWRLEACGRE